MDDLVRLLKDTQRPEEGPRKQAELDLKAAWSNPAFPGLLITIAGDATTPTEIRQSALSVLRQFIVRNWTSDSILGDDDDDDEDTSGQPPVTIDEPTRLQLRSALLELATRDDTDRRVKAAASFAVNKIASVDYPEQWPDLLQNLLNIIRSGAEQQVHGALRVLADLVDEGLGEMQFFMAAREIVEVLYGVAIDAERKPILRALAVSIFCSSFDVMDMVKEEHLREVKGFAQEALQGWLPFFHTIMKTQLPLNEPVTSGDGQQSQSWNGLVALKLQCVRTLLKIKTVFSSLLLPESPIFFRETWEELVLLKDAYASLYLEQDSQSRLEDADKLPYTLDFLILEELDFLNQCIRAPPVQKQLNEELAASGVAAHDTPWMVQLMGLLIDYARITREEEDMWNIDMSLYLAEEASLTVNYAARTACGDLLIKLGEWLGQRAIEGLFARTRDLFDPASPASNDWRAKESSLYLFTMLSGDLMDCNKTIPDDICNAYLQLVGVAINSADEPLLQSRGFLAAGLLAETYPLSLTYLDSAILAVTKAESEIVQAACIKSIEGFLKAENVPADAGVPRPLDRQVQVLQAINAWLGDRDIPDLEDSEDLLATLCETLRRAICLNPHIIVQNPEVPSIDLLFLIARNGANDFQVTYVVNETFEWIVSALSDPANYAALCARVIPTLNGFFTFSDMTKDEPLITMATELVAVLVQNGTEPLPAGFVGQLLPKLHKLLMVSDEGEVLRPGAEALKYMLSHDHQQVFEWHDEQGNNGLVVCLQIIDRLLGADVEDNSASEVGGLAAELVEKAGHQRLGDGMLQRLLQAVAIRLSTAQTAPFIQSLILVFARLCLTAAGEVVEFLATLTVGNENGLAVVLSKWLDNSMNFAGYDEIRQNVIALSKLYDLNDPRIAQTQVKGDLLPQTQAGIMTRSRAKQTPITDFFTVPPKDPDQYSIISAQLKIMKLLIEELEAAQGQSGAASLEAGGSAGATAAAEATGTKINAGDDEDTDGDDWEDEDDELLESLGMSKTDLYAYGNGNGGLMARSRDDETQAYLTEFFLRAAREDTSGFKGWYDQLAAGEQQKLNGLAAQ